MKYSKILLFMAALLCLAFQACAVSESLNDTSLNHTMVSSADWISPNIAQMATGTNSDPGLAGMLQWLDTPVPDFPWYTTGGSFYSQEYSDITFSPFTEYYVTSGTPVVGGIIEQSYQVRYNAKNAYHDILRCRPGIAIHPVCIHSAIQRLTTSGSKEQQAGLSMLVSPVGTWMQLVASAPVGGSARIYEIVQTDTTATKYSTYQFNQGYNTMNFYADQVGRHMLYFVVNNQPSNVVIVDVFAQSPAGNAAVSIYPPAR